MKLGIVGKPSSGKTTFFDAATLANAEIANYPFTTIKPNLGTAFVRVECPHKELGKPCNPRNAPCLDGTRFVPFQLMDVAGLVPGAHEGRGLGNQFLDDLMDASAFIHIVDFSGNTDLEGNPTKGHDPLEDIEFLEKEMDYWIFGIIKRNWDTISRKARMKAGKLEELVYEQVSGLSMDRESVEEIVRKLGITENSGEEDLWNLAREIRKSKPMIIAANKIDLEEAKKNYERIKRERPDLDIIPVSAEAELALKKASEAGIIKYIPGDSDFKIISDIDEKKKKALEYIRTYVLEPFGSTGVQRVLEHAVFDVLGMVVVFPVEDETHWTDNKGNVLPDAYLMPKGSTALDLAFAIHTEIGEKFIGAIDGRTKKRLGKEYVLKNRDVIKILVRK